LIVGAIVSLVSIGLYGFGGFSGQSSPPQHAVSSPAAVHSEIALIVVAIGATAVIVFTLAGTTVGAVAGHIGNKELAPIHAFIKTSLTAF
jgi:hypothetical protein